MRTYSMTSTVAVSLCAAGTVVARGRYEAVGPGDCDLLMDALRLALPTLAVRPRNAPAEGWSDRFRPERVCGS